MIYHQPMLIPHEPSVIRDLYMNAHMWRVLNGCVVATVALLLSVIYYRVAAVLLLILFYYLITAVTLLLSLLCSCLWLKVVGSIFRLKNGHPLCFWFGCSFAPAACYNLLQVVAGVFIAVGGFFCPLLYAAYFFS